jgi:hypothetical protein
MDSDVHTWSAGALGDRLFTVNDIRNVGARMKKQKAKRYERQLVAIISTLLLIIVIGIVNICFLLNYMGGLHDKTQANKQSMEILAREIRWLQHSGRKNQAIANDQARVNYLIDIFQMTAPTVYESAIECWKSGARYSINPYLGMAVIHRESFFNPNAMSYRPKVNQDDEKEERIPIAYGLMQINYRVWKNELGIDIEKIFNTPYNIDLGFRILKTYIKKHEGNISAALYDYYGGSLSDGSYYYPVKVLTSKFFTNMGG